MEQELAAIRRVVSVPRVVVDVGAAHGDFAARFCAEAELCLLFEPNPYFWPGMPGDPRLAHASVRVMPFAVSDRRRMGQLRVDCPEQLATLEPAWTKEWPPGTFSAQSRWEDVQVLAWADVVAWWGLREIDLVKLDCEGHDPVILRAVLAGDVLPRVILFEECARDERVAEALAAAEARGYETIERVTICPHRGYHNRVLARSA